MKIKNQILFRIAQILFGMCNTDCLNKFDFIINKLENSGGNEIKILKEQITRHFNQYLI